MIPDLLAPGLLSDDAIRYLCVDKENPMIYPFSEKLSEKGKISHGLSSYGYDATLAPVYKVFKRDHDKIIDPKSDSNHFYEDHSGPTCIIPPHGFLLGHTNEVFDLPEDVLSICLAKSTYARISLVVGVTPLEPGWRGQVTLEISNTSDSPALVYAEEGICQFLFFRSANKCRTPYNKRGGKYMDQKGIVLPKILE